MFRGSGILIAAVAAAAVAGAASAAPTKAASAGGGLKVGEYACYGTAGTAGGDWQIAGSRMGVLLGLGFKVLPGGRYTDLDGKNPGTYAVQGNTVVFKGGIHGGQTARNLKNNTFTLGARVGCEPW